MPPQSSTPQVDAVNNDEGQEEEEAGDPEVRLYLDMDPDTPEAHELANRIYCRTGYIVGPMRVAKEGPPSKQDKRNVIMTLSDAVEAMQLAAKQEKDVYEIRTGASVSKDSDGDYVHTDIATQEAITANQYAERFEKVFPVYVPPDEECAKNAAPVLPRDEAEKQLWLRWNDALATFHETASLR